MLLKTPKCLGAIFSFILLLIWVWVLISPIGCSWKNDNMNTESISPNGKVTLSWDEVHGATSYNAYLFVQPNLILQNKLMAYSIGMRRA